MNLFNLMKSKIICCLILTIPCPVQAFEINLDTNASVGQVYGDVNQTSVINQTNIPDGFGNYDGTNDFFDSSFFLLGSEASEAISVNSNPPLVETNIAVFNGIEIDTNNQNKDLVIEFDWIFQGNQQDISGFDLDLFTVSLVGTGTNTSGGAVDVDLEFLARNEYDDGRDYSYTVEGGLFVGSYTLVASVIESPDLPITNLLSVDNSAAGLGNINVTTVPFEFSPTLGILIVGGFGALSYLTKHQKNLRKFDSQD